MHHMLEHIFSSFTLSRILLRRRWVMRSVRKIPLARQDKPGNVMYSWLKVDSRRLRYLLTMIVHFITLELLHG